MTQSAREVLITYLRVMLDREDWHAVSDAANDLRVLEAEMAEQRKASARLMTAQGVYDAQIYSERNRSKALLAELKAALRKKA